MTILLAVSGRKNSGKTSWVTALVESFTGRGWRVGTVKHTHHHYDVPGKDTWRHQDAGAERVLLIAEKGSAIYESWESEPLLTELVDRHFDDFEIVFAEGYRGVDISRIIVGDDTSASSEENIVAHVPRAQGKPTDEELAVAVMAIENYFQMNDKR